MTPKVARKNLDQYGLALTWGKNVKVVPLRPVEATAWAVSRLSESRHQTPHWDRIVSTLSELEKHYQSLVDNPNMARDVEKNRGNLRKVMGIRRIDIVDGDATIRAVAFPNGTTLNIDYVADGRSSYKTVSPETDAVLLSQTSYEELLDKYIPGVDYPERLKNLWEVLDCKSDDQTEQMGSSEVQNPTRSIQFWLQKRQIVPGIVEYKSLSMGRGRDGGVTARIQDAHPETKGFLLRTVQEKTTTSQA